MPTSRVRWRGRRQFKKGNFTQRTVSPTAIGAISGFLSRPGLEELIRVSSKPCFSTGQALASPDLRRPTSHPLRVPARVR
jgi:hypothetical protein